MTTTTQVTQVDILDVTTYLGDFTEHYDLDAVQADYAAALNAALPEGVHLARNGMVFATLVAADAVREIDWEELAASVDLDAILRRHEFFRLDWVVNQQEWYGEGHTRWFDHGRVLTLDGEPALDEDDEPYDVIEVESSHDHAPYITAVTAAGWQIVEQDNPEQWLVRRAVR